MLQLPTHLGAREVAAERRPLARPVPRARFVAVGVVGGLLVISAAVTLLTCWLTIPLPQQLDEGEPLIYGLAGRILEGQSLYQPIDRPPFVQVHYTPLYYYAIALLRGLGLSGFGPGRVLSVLAGLVAAGGVAWLTARCSHSRWAGAFAVVLFLGLGFPGGPASFLSLVRVDMLGVALSVSAIAVLARATTRRQVVTAGVLAGLALLTKQTFFAAALAGGIWLLLRSRREAGVFGLAMALTVLGPGLVLEWSSGGSFWDNVGPANPSPTSLAYGAGLFRELVVTEAVPTVLAAGYVVATRAWRTPLARLVLLYWLATMPPVAGIIKAGANRNYWSEFAAANAMLATLAVWTYLRPHRRLLPSVASWLPLALLAAQVGALVPARLTTDRSFDPIPLSWSLTPEPFRQLGNQAAGFTNLVRAVAKEPGPVLAESVDVAVLSGHQVLFEPFAFSMLEQQGRWNSDPLVDDICAGRIGLLVLSYPIDYDFYPVGLHEFPMWPPSVMAALRASMQLAETRDWHWLYRPNAQHDNDAASIASCRAAAAAARQRASGD